MSNENKWTPLPSDILNEYENGEKRDNNIKAAEGRKDVIDATLADFGFNTRIEDYTVGPNVTRYNLRLKQNISIKSIGSIISDIQVRLGGVPVRFDTTTPGQSTVGIEIENPQPETVSFKELYESLPDVDRHPLAIPLGKKIDGEPTWIDLNAAPHMLITGTIGSGKSMMEESIITSLIMRNSPEDVQFVLIDTKKISFNRFSDIPHLYCPIVRDSKSIQHVLLQLIKEMGERYDAYCELNCCSFDEFNELMEENGLPTIPYIVVVIDDYADLVGANREIASLVLCLAQKSRASGIHLIVCTERPCTNALTGALKANLPTRLVFMASNTIDSITVIGEAGAEKLNGCGDMLVQSPLVSKIGLVRLQGCFIHRTEINRVVTRHFKK